jgi:hypothetical protein
MCKHNVISVKPSIMKRALVIVASVLSSATHATSYTGTPQQIVSQPSPTTTGNIRVSIKTGNATNCSGNPGWYSFDLPDGVVTNMWEATLLSAITAGNPVTIGGTGACDVYGLEIVTSVAALPN